MTPARWIVFALSCLAFALAFCWLLTLAGCSHAYVLRHPDAACWDRSDPRPVPPACIGGHVGAP